VANWTEHFRASVGWGDQLTVSLLPHGTACCSLPMDDGLHFWVPGLLDDMPGATAMAKQALQLSGCSAVTVLFLDQQATAAQVEEALHVAAQAGAGCDFLEPSPRALRDGLLLRMSEDTILDGAPSTPPSPD
jgi:hypothetical protein